MDWDDFDPDIDNTGDLVRTIVVIAIVSLVIYAISSVLN